MRVVTPPATRAAARLDRLALPSAIDDRLYFAQVREDPVLELEAIAPGPDDILVVVGSGGCTALSLLAAGAGHVRAVDMNCTQGHLIELKVAAITGLSRWDALAFLGAYDCLSAERVDMYAELRPHLSFRARAYWDSHLTAVSEGVLGAGVTERFVRLVMRALRIVVRPRSGFERMLACETIDAQQGLFAREWNTIRWRAFFHLLLNRVVFRQAYDPAFFSYLERPSFAEHFRHCAEHALTELPVRGNYFLHHMMTGRYDVDRDAVPPYLTEAACETIGASRDRLTLVDGTMTEYLRTLPDQSVSGFSLSNICEWLSPNDVDALFTEIVRTARRNAVLCFRNFVGWTEVPARFRRLVVEDRALGDELTARDRSVVQRRFATCRVNPES
jgi:S-adenosylmethionine-diacylglycerol 3-amino-3-carboxypropyl transferase